MAPLRIAPLLIGLCLPASCAKMESIISAATVRFGSEADLSTDLTRMSASGSKAALQLLGFELAISAFHLAAMNVCFSRKRPFKKRQI
jgi:hypothetical protein